MPKKTIEYLLSLKVKDADKKELAKDLKGLEAQAKDLAKALDKATTQEEARKLSDALQEVNRELIIAAKNAEKLDDQLEKASKSAARLEELGGKLTQVGGFLGGVGAAILAPIALLEGRFLASAKDAESERLNIVSNAAKEINDIEQKRADVVQQTAEKIKGYDNQIKENRIRAADLAREAERASRQVSIDLARELRGLDQSEGELRRNQERRIFDLTHDLTAEQSKQLQIQRAQEDFQLSIKKLEQQRADARKKAAAEQKKIIDERNKAAAELAKKNKEIEEQKKDTLNSEKAVLAGLSAEEARLYRIRESALKAQSETAKELIEVTEKWNDTLDRLSVIVSEELQPTLEAAVGYADKIAGFIEDNPGVIKAAIGIGGTLATLGGLLAGAGVIVQSLGAVQKIATIAGVPLGGGGGIGAALGPALSSALTSAAPVIVPILALAIGAEIGRRLVEAVTGQEYTWEQIRQDFKNLFVLSAEGWDILFNWFGLETNISGVLANAFNTSDLFMIEKLEKQGNSIKDGLQNSIRNLAKEHARAVREAAISTINGFKQSLTFVVESILILKATLSEAITKLVDSIKSAFTGSITKLVNAIPKKAGGGDIGPGLFFGGEQGREYVMNNKTTRAAESMIGGRLSQENLLAAISRGRVQYNDNRRFEATPSPFDRRKMVDEMVTALSGVFS